MNKMAKGDEYLDYLDKILEHAAKPWSALLGAFLETKWQVLNSLKCPHRTGREKTGKTVASISCWFSLKFVTTKSEVKPFNIFNIYSASCLLCITHKKTTSKEQRLQHNWRPSDKILDCPSCLANY